MKRALSLLLTVFALAAIAMAQTPAAAPAAPDTGSSSGLLPSISDPANIALVSYGLAQVASSTTDWQFTLGGKQYNVSPVQRTAFAGATVFGALAIAHYFPKAKPYVTA